MSDNYFEYVLSKCRSQVIKSVCERFQTRAHLQKSIVNTWGDYPTITNDSELLYALRDLFQYGAEFRLRGINGDFLIVYNRCKETLDVTRAKWRNREGLDYDDLFNTLVDLCWLLASNEFSVRNGYKNVMLLSSSEKIRIALRTYLDCLYEEAIKEYNETVYIDEGIKAKNKHPIMPALYDNSFDESIRYIRSDLTCSQLQNEKYNHKYWCKYNLILYYALTATAALADNIRRGLV